MVNPLSMTQNDLFSIEDRPSPSQLACLNLVAHPVGANSPSLRENNHRFHKWITDGVDVQYHAPDGRVVNDIAWLIDFAHPDNNNWLILNHLPVLDTKNNRHPDILI